MDLEIRISEPQWEELERGLRAVPAAIPKATVAAVNRTGQTGATRIRRRLAGVLGVGVRTLGRRVKWLRATWEKPYGKIRLAEYNLKAIESRQTPVRGQAYPLAKIANPVALQNTPFRQTMLSGHLGWFVRFGAPRPMSKGRYVGKVREPIKEVWVPGAASAWNQSPAVAAEELSQLRGVLQKNVESQISRYLKASQTTA